MTQEKTSYTLFMSERHNEVIDVITKKITNHD